jgi:hypothetical protein
VRLHRRGRDGSYHATRHEANAARERRVCESVDRDGAISIERA